MVDVVRNPARGADTNQAELHMAFPGIRGQAGKLADLLVDQIWHPVEEGSSMEKAEAAGIEVVEVGVVGKGGLELSVDFDNLADESHSAKASIDQHIQASKDRFQVLKRQR